MEAILALEDGTVFHGHAAGAEGEARGEVVFNTSMTVYQEVLTVRRTPARCDDDVSRDRQLTATHVCPRTSSRAAPQGRGIHHPR
jgi:hypothetical protein